MSPIPPFVNATPFACGLLADGRIVRRDLVEEVFKWAADEPAEYTHPQRFLVSPVLPRRA